VIRGSVERTRPASGVHIVAMGSRTPLGLTAESSAAAVRGRITRLAEHPFMVDLRGQPIRMARDARLDPGLFGAPRMLEMAAWALDEVVRKLGHPASRTPIPVSVGMPEPRPGFSEQEARWVASELARKSRIIVKGEIAVAAEGHAAVLHGIETAFHRISGGSCDLMIVGGVDTYLHPDTLIVLDANRRLGAESVRLGFSPGEGACFLALASERGLSELGLPSLARVLGARSARDTGAGGPAVGQALAEALTGAAGVQIPGQGPIDEIYCDINGERRRTEEWGFAVLRTQELWREPSAYRTPVTEWGDTGAATGGLLVTLAVWAGLRRYAKGPRTMIWTASDGGLRSAAVLSLPEA
jgi:3-oxoacyl-[acyl-carrier-protein] synthase-1